LFDTPRNRRELSDSLVGDRIPVNSTFSFGTPNKNVDGELKQAMNHSIPITCSEMSLVCTSIGSRDSRRR